MPLINNPKDFYSGLLFAGFGLASLIISLSYRMGTASAMGAGYFPRAIGVLMVGLGILLSLLSLRTPPQEEQKITWRLRPLAVILGSISVYALFGEWLGLVLGSLILVFLAAMAREGFNWKESLILGAILGVVSAGIFIWGLGLPLTVWPAFVYGGM